MNYLLDRKSKRNRYFKWAAFVCGVILFFYFGASFLSALSGAGHAIFRPVLILGNNIGGKFASIGPFFSTKTSLTALNDQLKAELEAAEARMANYNVLLDENENLKEVLGRKKEDMRLVLSAILSKPNQTPYDTLIIDQGDNNGIQAGQRVFAWGNIPIGRIAEVYGNSAKVILFSSSGEKTEGVIGGKDIFVEAVGRGGGNFEILLPRDLAIPNGTEVTLPGITPRVLGVIERVVSSPRDAFQKVLMISPVNIFELKFVQVEI